MRTVSLAALAAISLLAAAVSAETVPSLEQAFSGFSQVLKPQAAALKQSVSANAAARTPVRKAHEFNLDYEGGRWRLRLDPNPPGSGLKIDVTVGELVRLNLYNNTWGRHDDAQFLVRSLGIDVWLRSFGESATVEFNAKEEGIHLINDSSRAGLIIIRKK